MERKKRGFNLIYIVKEMVHRFSVHEVGHAGAQLAYFFILSIFPFFIFLNALIGLLHFSPEMVTNSLGDVAPPEVSRILQNYIRFLNARPSTGLFSFGIITTVLSSSKAFDSLVYTLKKSYKNKENKSGISKKLFSILLTLLLGATILLSLVTLAIGRDFWLFLSNYFSLPPSFVESWTYLKWLIVFGTLFLALGILHFFVPDKRPKLRQIVPGTLFSIFAWVGFSVVFSYYVKNFAKYSAIYGSLGAIIILLLWLYLTGVIIVMGGELNAILMETEDGMSMISSREEHFDKERELALKFSEETERSKPEIFVDIDEEPNLSSDTVPADEGPIIDEYTEEEQRYCTDIVMKKTDTYHRRPLFKGKK